MPLNSCCIRILLCGKSESRFFLFLSLQKLNGQMCSKLQKSVKASWGGRGCILVQKTCACPKLFFTGIGRVLGQPCPRELCMCVRVWLFPLCHTNFSIISLGLLVQRLLISLLHVAWSNNAKSKMGMVLANTEVLNNFLPHC